MKRILALLLVLLMALPFGAITMAAADAEKVEVPKEPVPTFDTKVYVSFQKTSGVQASDANTGTSADQPLATWKSTFDMINLTGGVVCFPGKGYVGSNYTIAKADNTITLTSFDHQLNKRYEGTVEVDNGDGTFANGTQIGMVMIAGGRTLTIEGDVVFDNLDLIERNVTPTTISVANGGKLVIEDDVNVYKMTNTEATMILNVDAGGYIYLKSSGFSKYTGDGVIVIDKDFYKSDKFDANMFLEFNGAIVSPDGTLLDGVVVAPPDDPVLVPDDSGNDPADTKKPPSSVTKVPTSSETPETTTVADAEEAGDFPIVPVIIGAVAAVIVVAAVIIVIVKKKKA